MHAAGRRLNCRRTYRATCTQSGGAGEGEARLQARRFPPPAPQVAAVDAANAERDAYKLSAQEIQERSKVGGKKQRDGGLLCVGCCCGWAGVSAHSTSEQQGGAMRLFIVFSQ